MIDVVVLGQAGYWSMAPTDMAVFFHLVAQHVPILADADGTVKAVMVGKTFDVMMLHQPEDGEFDGGAEEKEAYGHAVGKSGKAAGGF